jgi:hypothetical protein
MNTYTNQRTQRQEKKSFSGIYMQIGVMVTMLEQHHSDNNVS